jgi:hypothetical protein
MSVRCTKCLWQSPLHSSRFSRQVRWETRSRHRTDDPDLEFRLLQSFTFCSTLKAFCLLASSWYDRTWSRRLLRVIEPKWSRRQFDIALPEHDMEGNGELENRDRPIPPSRENDQPSPFDVNRRLTQEEFCFAIKFCLSLLPKDHHLPFLEHMLAMPPSDEPDDCASQQEETS